MPIEVRSRVSGAVGEDLPTVLLEWESETVTARELVRRAVEEQIRVLNTGPGTRHKALDRQYQQAGDPQRAAEVDVEAEVRRALRAFERGVFTVFTGGRQVGSLDEELRITLGEPVVFLRLVALQGG
jgi:hypothetical protein